MIMIDTSILVDILRKKIEVREILESLAPEPLITCEICSMELFYGIYSNKIYREDIKLRTKRGEEVTKLLTKFLVLNFDRKSARKTAELMGTLKLEGNMIDFRDGMIAGIAISYGIDTILTKNKTHFEKIKNINII